MAVTGKELTTVRTRRAPIAAAPNLAPAAYLTTLVLAVLAIYVLVGAVVDQGKVLLDDMRYGRPRTMHLAGYVGHAGEAPGQPTRFIAMNMDRQVVVLVMPGGDAAQVRSLPGPYLFGAGENLTPVKIALHDMDRDGYNDLIIDVRSEQVVYLNRDGGFRLPTAEEQQRILEER